jgi:hypothetical protein
MKIATDTTVDQWTKEEIELALSQDHEPYEVNMPKKRVFRSAEDCGCQCHKDPGIMHFMDCCDECYKQI